MDKNVKFESGDKVQFAETGYTSLHTGWTNKMLEILGEIGIIIEGSPDVCEVVFRDKLSGQKVWRLHPLDLVLVEKKQLSKQPAPPENPVKKSNDDVEKAEEVADYRLFDRTRTGRYDIRVSPEKLNLERVIRENDEDKQDAFLLIGPFNCLAGIRKELYNGDDRFSICWTPDIDAQLKFILGNWGNDAIRKASQNWVFKLCPNDPDGITEAKSVLFGMIDRREVKNIIIADRPKRKQSTPRRKYIVRHWRRKT